MGGAIALLTASRHTVTGVTVVNPGLSFYDPRIRVISVLKHFVRTTAPLEEENPTAFRTEDGDYSRTPLASVHQLKKLFRSAHRNLPTVVAPVLVFKSMTDSVVPPSSLDMIREGLVQSKLEVISLPNSGHVATLDVDASEIFTKSAQFFLEHADHHISSEKS